jgi:tetratricopeptide (TPR) repeat protein
MHLTRFLAAAGAVALVACASAGRPSQSAGADVKEGVRVAELGYWQEAYFRFNRANQTTPGDEVILNDLAVAQEALGRYDEALATYKLALAKAPKSSAIRKNYARFAEFFTSYARGARPKGDEGATR